MEVGCLATAYVVDTCLMKSSMPMAAFLPSAMALMASATLLAMSPPMKILPTVVRWQREKPNQA